MLDERSEPLDARIDAVARQMTDAEAPANLRARVLSRIAAGERPHSMPDAWIWSSAAIAVALLVVAVFLSGWHLFNGYKPPPVAMRGEAHTPPNVVKGPLETQAPLRATYTAHEVRRRPGTPKPNDAAPFADLQLSPLAIEPMQLTAIETPEPTPPDAIRLTPITVAPLTSEGEK